MKLVDINKLSEIIGVKKKTIYDWTHKGIIPHKKLRRLLRFDLNAIERWLNSKKCNRNHRI